MKRFTAWRAVAWALAASAAIWYAIFRAFLAGRGEW